MEEYHLNSGEQGPIILAMPFYDYKCRKCSGIFEVSKGMNENIEAKCPKCGGTDTQRIFSPVRTVKGAKDIMGSYGKENSSGCDTCSSGVCSDCSCK